MVFFCFYTYFKRESHTRGRNIGAFRIFMKHLDTKKPQAALLGKTKFSSSQPTLISRRRFEKYLSKLNISRSFIRIFMKHLDTLAR